MRVLSRWFESKGFATTIRLLLSSEMVAGLVEPAETLDVIRRAFRSETMVVDTLAQGRDDSGDIVDALQRGVLDESRIIELAQLVSEDRILVRSTDPARNITAFKSAGTALQDLALARHVYDRAHSLGVGVDTGEITGLKELT